MCRWSHEEDKRLRALATQLGVNNWPLVAERSASGPSSSDVVQHWCLMARKRKHDGTSAAASDAQTGDVQHQAQGKQEVRREAPQTPEEASQMARDERLVLHRAPGTISGFRGVQHVRAACFRVKVGKKHLGDFPFLELAALHYARWTTLPQSISMSGATITTAKTNDRHAKDTDNGTPVEEGVTMRTERPMCRDGLFNQVQRISALLGIQTNILPMAIQEANELMGVAGTGSLPAQAAMLLSELGMPA